MLFLKRIFMFLHISLCIWAIEYSYPVGSDGQFMYLIRQDESRRLCLYRQHMQSRTIKKVHYSFNQEIAHAFNIADFCMLPDCGGYSFIDSGRLRVKYHDAFSPLSVDFLYPLYDIHSVLWRTREQGIVCAKYKNCFGLFHFSVDGRVKPLLWTGGSDYISPQLVNDTIFCLECSFSNQTSTIVSAHIQSMKLFRSWNDLSFDEQIAIIMKKNDFPSQGFEIQSVMSNINCYFFSMKDEKSGIIVTIDSLKDGVYTFSCKVIEKLANGWKYKQVFTFTLPAFLFTPSEGLVEKKRLMPCIHKDSIIFSDSCGTYDRVGIFSCSFQANAKEAILCKQNVIYFGIQPIDGFIYFSELSYKSIATQ